MREPDPDPDPIPTHEEPCGDKGPGRFDLRFALRAVGEAANQRLCDAQADAQPAPDVVTFNQVTRPSAATPLQPLPAHPPRTAPNRYQLTPLGRRVAVLFTKAHGRVLTPGLVALDPRLPEDIAHRSPLARAWRQLDHALDDFIAGQLVAART